ncbi:MAG: DHH family phosphoesterase [archaeon]
MLSSKQIKEIREHLEKAQNPIFYFDNDGDGLCSFLLLQRYIGRGKGVAIKSFPELTGDYFRRVNELNADYIFILDKAVVSKEFFEEARKVNIPIVWIDHHLEEKHVPEFISYYNPVKKEHENAQAVTAFCYQVSQKKEDLWLAVVGCISDGFIPEFYPDFIKEYPDLAKKLNNSLEIYYTTQIGKIVKIFNFALKDRITNVINMLRFLMKAKSPYEVLEDSSKTYTMHKRFNEINKKYQRLLDKARKVATKDKLLFFKYGGDLSISSDLANELTYLYPNRVIVVAYTTGIKANISGRGKSVKPLIMKAINGLENSTAGGHDVAVGAKVMIDDLEEFRTRLLESVK